MKYQYHATPDKNAVVMSCEQAVSGWLAPSAGLGYYVAGMAETVMETAAAAEFIKHAVAAGNKVSRGKDVSSNGLFSIRADIKSDARHTHK